MKKETLSIKEFLHGKDPVPFSAKVKRHFEKYGMVYKITGATVVVFMAGGGFDYAFAAGAIDTGAKKLYYEIVNIGKWIIIFKGGIDTIKAVGDGDFPTAKKQFFQYLLIYLMLLGLPYGMDKVDQVFKGISQA
ncbi:hypothetical protein [Cytobacillus firmus]|uniref:hypothetical protein n=1 Tax=Cytobacillus firmus TaxID=1399 RepID=UPI0018CF576F|nr:hypothetical protein [Cytobacillus firmus]MBG9548472.1 hypothetical protein [Cytobacillus firmus]MBG9602809.1 hypothetical protein [Cytobacillus firmus]MBG9655018.1 hypothetical protein [Cytobacillus firmus]MED1908602.1 hypothetical protein [Cytobacillus firmus]MED1943002.1 hypothetical protein [Cytobacillus firmus]